MDVRTSGISNSSKMKRTAIRRSARLLTRASAAKAAQPLGGVASTPVCEVAEKAKNVPRAAGKAALIHPVLLARRIS
jgi:hypothetical protein